MESIVLPNLFYGLSAGLALWLVAYIANRCWLAFWSFTH